ncbi:hypothetical protein QEZ52_16725 [Aliisedimentitalea scapharcae]|uniref:Uncharacterized protein n=1 Tax=Aliisedimentitalea scapharcae TaxID=1524259 RepID=A0ABZ2XSB4_9RHOB
MPQKWTSANRLTLALFMTLFPAQIALAGNESRYEAYRLSDNTFEVIADFSENAIYWCGASLYARGVFSNDATQKIYVLQSPSPSVAKPNFVSVRFGFQPPKDGATYSGWSNSVDIIGNSRSIAQAFSGCTERSASG